MPETFKCPQCGALYEVIHDEIIDDESPSEDRQAAHCQVCGRAMETRSGPRAQHYELVRMPDGTAICGLAPGNRIRSARRHGSEAS